MSLRRVEPDDEPTVTLGGRGAWALWIEAGYYTAARLRRMADEIERLCRRVGKK